MKKTTTIGAVIAVLLIGIFVILFILNRMAPQVQEDAQNYVDTNVPLIVQNWDSTELIKQAGSGLLKAASHEQFVELFAMLSQKFGPLKEYKGSRGTISLTTSYRGIARTGIFEAEAVFAQAPAAILCRLVWQHGAWKFEEFRVKPEVLNP